MFAHDNDLGAHIKKVAAINPLAAQAAGAANGAAIDRLGYMSMSFIGQCGAATGTPSAQSVTFKLQESADGSTGWADIADADADALTADNGVARIDLNLQARKRYIRAVATVAFTAGTSPTISVAGVAVLGGADALPAA